MGGGDWGRRGGRWEGVMGGGMMRGKRKEREREELAKVQISPQTSQYLVTQPNSPELQYICKQSSSDNPQAHY